MLENLYELDQITYERLKNNIKLLKEYGWKVATNSLFKPFEYGYYGCRVYEDKVSHRYYLAWKRRKKKIKD